MTHQRKEVKGAAAALTLASGINNSVTSLTANGSVTGWPTGASWPFVIQIDDEKILCSSLTGSGPATIAVTARGFDDTTAASHASSAPIRHVLDAETLFNVMAHVFNTGLDDHTQYIRTDGTRAFSGVGSIAGSPVDIGTALANGAALTLARSDHVHKLGTGAINAAGMFAAGVVDAAAIGADQVGTSEIAPLAVTAAEIAAATITKAKFDPEVPLGKLGYDTSTDATSGITVETAVSSLSVTVTPLANRLIRIVAQVNITGLGSGERAEVRIKKDGVEIEQGAIYGTSFGHAQVMAFDIAPSVASHTYTVTVEPEGGLSISLEGGIGLGPHLLAVYDDGPS